MSHPLHKAHEKSIKGKEEEEARAGKHVWDSRARKTSESQKAEWVLHSPTFVKWSVRTFHLCLFTLCNILPNTWDPQRREALAHAKQDPNSAEAAHCHQECNLEIFRAECVYSRTLTGRIWCALGFIFAVHAYQIVFLTEMSLFCRLTFAKSEALKKILKRSMTEAQPYIREKSLHLFRFTIYTVNTWLHLPSYIMLHNTLISTWSVKQNEKALDISFF